MVSLWNSHLLGRGGSLKRNNPGRMAWEKLAKKKKCIVQVKNNLCCAGATVIMKELTDKGCHYNNLKRGKPIQERWARLLHQEAGVPEGPCGFEELQKFQEFLGPQKWYWLCITMVPKLLPNAAYNYDQNPSGFCFLVEIIACLI